MAAEAEAQSGGSNAAKYLNQVRARAYGNNNHDYVSTEGDLLNVIFNERRKELAGEGHRFFDLVRTGRAAQAIEGFVAGKHELFPIPFQEIQFSAGNWDQNPNY